MKLYDDQREAVMFDAPRTWKRIQVPRGKLPVNPKVIALTIDKRGNYANSWSYCFAVSALPILRNLVFNFNPVTKCYTAICPDTGLLIRYFAEEAQAVEGGWVTPKSAGMGGTGSRITLDDGRSVLLQGFWVGSSDENVRVVLVTSPEAVSLSYAGYAMRNSDFIRSASQLQPDYDFALINTDGWCRVAMAERGLPPKGFTEEQKIK